ncbi:MAG TPA: hypothetical protein VIA29_05665 [Thermoanaerobaculia bacterium]|jgi:hypothetical protein
MLLRPQARFDLARRLRARSGAPIGEVFTFLSGLYFRGKAAYANRFARPVGALPGAWVITPNAGLLPLEARVTHAMLCRFSEGSIDPRDPRYVRPLLRDVRRILAAERRDLEFVLLGSVASGKYIEPLLETVGPRLVFPPDFVGRGDMSRGGLMLRRARENIELPYAPVAGSTLHGPRPPKLPRRRYSQ